MESSFILCFFGLFLLIGMILLASAVKIVREDTRLTVYRLGRNIGDKGPGLVLLIPIIDKGEVKQLGGAGRTPSTRQVPRSGMVGAVGETLTSVFRDGKVSFSGEEWDAVSQTPVAAARRVRVTRMLLEVEEE